MAQCLSSRNASSSAYTHRRAELRIKQCGGAPLADAIVRLISSSPVRPVRDVLTFTNSERRRTGPDEDPGRRECIAQRTNRDANPTFTARVCVTSGWTGSEVNNIWRCHAISFPHILAADNLYGHCNPNGHSSPDAFTLMHDCNDTQAVPNRRSSCRRC